MEWKRISPRQPWLTRLLMAANTLLAGLACSFALWDPLEVDDRARIGQATLRASRNVIAAVDENFRREIRELRRMVGGPAAGGFSYRALRSEVFRETHPAYLQIYWIDSDGRNALELDTGPATRGRDFETHPDLKRTLDLATVTTGGAVISQYSRCPMAQPAKRIPGFSGSGNPHQRGGPLGQDHC